MLLLPLPDGIEPVTPLENSTLLPPTFSDIVRTSGATYFFITQFSIVNY